MALHIYTAALRGLVAADLAALQRELAMPHHMDTAALIGFAAGNPALTIAIAVLYGQLTFHCEDAAITHGIVV